MSRNPYELPDDGRRFIVNVSGGRSSGFMLRRMLDAHGGRLPDYAIPVFTNTGKEREQTLVFLRRMAEAWGVPITWLEYRYRPGAAGGLKDRKNAWEEVDFVSASRDGEPFRALISSRRMLPTVTRRMCTEELKVNTIARWVRDVVGWGPKTRWWSVLGIRHDERRRWGKVLFEECRVVYPMVDAEVDEETVLTWWAGQPFDLELLPMEGNCDLCFLKGVGKLKRLIRRDPAAADWWIEQERFRAAASRRAFDEEANQRFLGRVSYTELLSRALSMLPLDGEDGDGEESISCFCGD